VQNRTRDHDNILSLFALLIAYVVNHIRIFLKEASNILGSSSNSRQNQGIWPPSFVECLYMQVKLIYTYFLSLVQTIVSDMSFVFIAYKFVCHYNLPLNDSWKYLSSEGAKSFLDGAPIKELPASGSPSSTSETDANRPCGVQVGW